MKKLVLKGVDPIMLTKYVKKSALLSLKRDSIISDILPLYIYGERVVSIKQDGSKSTFKIWELPLNEFCDNHEEVKEKLGDMHCRVAIFSCKQFVTKGLKYFKDKINIELLIDEEGASYDAKGVLTISNDKAKFRFSVTEPNHAFNKISGGWDFVDQFFSAEKDNPQVAASFTISEEELKQIKELTKLENVIDKKHEFVNLQTKDGKLMASSHSADIVLHESEISLQDVKMKNDVIRTLCDETYNVHIKNFNNVPLILFKSVDTKTSQSIVLLTEFNTNVDLKSVEDEIANVDFTEWDGQDDDPLF